MKICQKKKENMSNKGNSKIIVNKKNIKAKKYQKFLQAYQSYIQKIKKTIKNKKDEEKQNFIISKYYDILNNMQDLSEFLDSIKEQFCLNCESNFNNSKSIKLPCGCCMCNIECIINAFTSFNKLEGINLFCCVCSHIYKPEELYQFAIMGQLYSKAVFNTKEPKTYLYLNLEKKLLLEVYFLENINFYFFLFLLLKKFCLCIGK